jgi:hypothetical protein
MNDGGWCASTGEIVSPHTFGQIADLVEGWFPSYT